MGVFIFLLVFFAVIGITAFIYLFKKIRCAVRYLCPDASKKKNILISAAVYVLLLVPGYFIFIKWFIILMHLTAFLFIADMAALAARKLRKAKTYPGWFRFTYQTGLAAILLTAIVTGYAKYNMYRIVCTEYDVTVDKQLSAEYNIALLADMHYGISLDARQLQAAADSIEEHSPDFVILCGDLVDESTKYEQMREAFAILGGIKSTYGVYYVYGNHDRSLYSPSPNFTADQLRDSIIQSGITILEDDVTEINGEIFLVGRADKSITASNRKSIQELLNGLDRNRTVIVADHQPAEYDLLEEAGCQLVLSGHTHAGQTFPLGLLNDLIGFSDQNYGYKKRGNLNAVVTSGIAGWGYDLRTEQHSEYVIIHVKGK